LSILKRAISEVEVFTAIGNFVIFVLGAIALDFNSRFNNLKSE